PTQHVSDTARMVAACRALETVRPDGLVHDPFAQRLAGTRAMALARESSQIEVLCFGIGMRSRFLDDLVIQSVTEGKVASVWCLGAGLDTRPWRLDLPQELQWIEVDFGPILDYKAGIMDGTPPRCRLERLSADLNDPSERGKVLAAIDSG